MAELCNRKFCIPPKRYFDIAEKDLPNDHKMRIPGGKKATRKHRKRAHKCWELCKMHKIEMAFLLRDALTFQMLDAIFEI